MKLSFTTFKREILSVFKALSFPENFLLVFPNRATDFFLCRKLFQLDDELLKNASAVACKARRRGKKIFCLNVFLKNRKLIISISLTLSKLPCLWFRSHYKNRKKWCLLTLILRLPTSDSSLFFLLKLSGNFSYYYPLLLNLSKKFRKILFNLFHSKSNHHRLISHKSDHRLTLEATTMWIHNSLTLPSVWQNLFFVWTFF